MRPFLIAMALGLAALAWLAAMLTMPVDAETVHTWGSPFYASTITIQPTDPPEIDVNEDSVGRVLIREWVGG
jgi:hypothetical protein